MKGRTRLDVHAINTLAGDGVDRRLELIGALHREWADDEAEPTGYLVRLGKASDKRRDAGVEQEPYSASPPVGHP